MRILAIGKDEEDSSAICKCEVIGITKFRGNLRRFRENFQIEVCGLKPQCLQNLVAITDVYEQMQQT